MMSLKILNLPLVGAPMTCVGCEQVLRRCSRHSNFHIFLSRSSCKAIPIQRPVIKRRMSIQKRFCR